MGAGQSTKGARQSSGGGTLKTSYYAILGIEKSATDDEYVLLPILQNSIALLNAVQNQESLPSESS
jgi:hypothetical protein